MLCRLNLAARPVLTLTRSVPGAVLFALFLALSSRAEIPEPANVFYGLVNLGTNPVSAANTAVVVEARQTPNGPAVASYRMGSQPALNNYYSLRVNLESGGPSLDSNSVQTGDATYLTLTLAGVVQEQKKINAGARGQITRMDFGAIDSDHNGLPDSWELQYFGRIGLDPNTDVIHDGFTVARDFALGLNPNLPKYMPADSSPADWTISVAELGAYALAWKTGAAWSNAPTTASVLAPTNIPISFVSRAAMLWKLGQHYRADGSASNAPLWWVSLSNAPALPLAQSWALSQMPDTYIPGQPLPVTLLVQPITGVNAYAVEETVPPGWAVTNITQGGRFDPAAGKIRWGLWADGLVRSLSYQAIPPAGGIGLGQFAGIASFDGVDVIVGGTRTVGGSDTVVRALPRYYAGGVALTVTNYAVPFPGIMLYAVADTPPAGWLVSNISDSGYFDSGAGQVNWTFFDDTPRALTYRLTPPVAPLSTVVFSGEAVFDAITIPIAGDTVISPIPALRLAVPTITRPNPPAYHVTYNFVPVPGYDHFADYRDSLSAGAWQPLPGGPFNGGMIVDNPPGPTRFYRLRLVPKAGF